MFHLLALQNYPNYSLNLYKEKCAPKQISIVEIFFGTSSNLDTRRSWIWKSTWRHLPLSRLEMHTAYDYLLDRRLPKNHFLNTFKRSPPPGIEPGSSA